MNNKKNNETRKVTSYKNIASLFKNASQAREFWEKTHDYRSMKENNPDGNHSFELGWFLEWLFKREDSEIVDLVLNNTKHYD